MVYKLFDKKSSGSGVATEPNYELVNKLHRQFIRNFKKRKVYSSFRDNFLGIDLADMQLMSKLKIRIKSIEIFFVWFDSNKFTIKFISIAFCLCIS